MHDDLGAGLSTIRFLSEKVKRNSFSDVTKDDADKIVINSNELVEKMNDIIWAMNEKNDSLEDLLFYSRSYAMEYCEDNNLECNVFLPDPIPDIFISGEIRRNIFLTIKESLHNIVKHASASKVEIRFDIDEHLMVRILDNGKGMMENQQGEGNGLINMQKRMALLNGSLTMKTEQGVVIEFQVPLNQGMIKRSDPTAR
jgi:signal transduction histidine kinase